MTEKIKYTEDFLKAKLKFKIELEKTAQQTSLSFKFLPRGTNRPLPP